MFATWKKSYNKPREYIKKQRHHFANKGPHSQSNGFSSSHVQMWELDYRKAECQRIDEFELWCWRTVEGPLDFKEIKLVNPKRNQPWIYIGRTDAEAEVPILWPPDVMSWLTGKDPDAEKDWRQEEKGMTEDEMVGWYHRLNGPEFGQTQGDSKGQESLVCPSLWGGKKSDRT